MTSQPNSLRKAVDRSEPTNEKLPPRRPTVDTETIISESRRQYRGIIEAINRSSDKDIDRALKAASF